MFEFPACKLIDKKHQQEVINAPLDQIPGSEPQGTNSQLGDRTEKNALYFSFEFMITQV